MNARMNGKVFAAISILLLGVLACSAVSVPADTNRIIGSGKVSGETRDVAEFTAVELAGSGDVNILLGNGQSVNVQSDDNIVPLIETKVVNGTLVVSMKPLTNVTTSSGIVVTVVMKALQHLTLSGSGNIHVGEMSGPELAVDLPGSGSITVMGRADRVNISLAGSGNVFCEGLKASSANVRLNGSGNVTVYTDKSLDASLTGSGSIHYSGEPAQVTKSITGSGTITP